VAADEHRVLANVRGQQLPMPITPDTINRLYDLDLDSEAAVEAFLAERAEPRERVETSEDSCVARFGRDLYEAFFRGYTRKQWARDPSELHASVCARIPIRFNQDDRYFGDAFQKMPIDGYTAMFERILDHPNIEVRTGTDFADVLDEISYDQLAYTGPIDEFYDPALASCPTAASSSSTAPSRPRTRARAAGGDHQRAQRGCPVHADDRVPPPDGPDPHLRDAGRRVPAR